MEFYAIAGVVREELMSDNFATPERLKGDIIACLPRLRRFCWAIAGNAEDGDDLMQSTVAKALERGHQFELGTNLASWLFRIAKNLRIDAARVAARQGQQLPIDALGEQAGEDGRVLVENRSELAAAQNALHALPDDQRATFALVVIEGLSYREAADLLEIPVGTVMSRLARARGRIEQVIGRTSGRLQ